MNALDRPPLLYTSLDSDEVVSFKARTKHGSGIKEVYSLDHCTDLKLEPNVRSKRSPDYMKSSELSILHWDYCKTENLEPSPLESTPKEVDEELLAVMNVGDSLLYARYCTKYSSNTKGNDLLLEKKVTEKSLNNSALSHHQHIIFPRTWRFDRSSFTVEPTCHDFALGSTEKVPYFTNHGTSQRKGSDIDDYPYWSHADWSDPSIPDFRLLVGFKSGLISILKPNSSSSSFTMYSSFNESGVICNGEVTNVRFIPRTGGRQFLATFNTGEMISFDTRLQSESLPQELAEQLQTPLSSASSTKQSFSSTVTGISRMRIYNGANDSKRPANASSITAVASKANSSRHINIPKGKGSFAAKQKDRLQFQNLHPKSKGNSETMEVLPCLTGHNPIKRWRICRDGRSNCCNITALAFSPTGSREGGRRLLACTSKSGILRVIDFDTQELVVAFRPWFGGLLCVDWSPDGRFLATGGEDDAVCLWSIEEKKAVMRGTGHTSWVTSVCFDKYIGESNVYRFASVGEDANLCSWEYNNNEKHPNSVPISILNSNLNLNLNLNMGKKSESDMDVESSRNITSFSNELMTVTSDVTGGDSTMELNLDIVCSEDSKISNFGAFQLEPPIQLASVPIGLPLCCKRLARLPFSKVSIIRSGIVTLCEEGLIKVWKRPVVLLPKKQEIHVFSSIPSLPEKLLESSSNSSQNFPSLLREETDVITGVLITPLAGQRGVPHNNGSRKRASPFSFARTFFFAGNEDRQNHMNGSKHRYLSSNMPVAASLGLVPAVGIKDYTPGTPLNLGGRVRTSKSNDGPERVLYISAEQLSSSGGSYIRRNNKLSRPTSVNMDV